MTTWTCYWCGDVIDPDAGDELISVIGGEPHHNAHVLATFHGGDQPCYSEAKDYGWN